MKIQHIFCIKRQINLAAGSRHNTWLKSDLNLGILAFGILAFRHTQKMRLQKMLQKLSNIHFWSFTRSKKKIWKTSIFSILGAFGWAHLAGPKQKFPAFPTDRFFCEVANMYVSTKKICLWEMRGTFCISILLHPFFNEFYIFSCVRGYFL